MASRSAVIPFFETAAFIQYQNTQGLADAGGLAKFFSANAKPGSFICALLANANNNRKITKYILVYRIYSFTKLILLFPLSIDVATAIPRWSLLFTAQ